MLRDRGCVIADYEFTRPLSEFRLVFGDEPDPDHLRICVPLASKPSKKVTVLLGFAFLRWSTKKLCPPVVYLSVRGQRRRESRQTRKMHSFGYRANALLTFSLTILALMCAMASLSDNLNSPSPTATVKVLNINRFQKKSSGDDEVGITLDISADLQSLFTWNTKQVFVFLAAEYSTPKNVLNQVSLWDGIIPEKDGAQFSIKTKNKYRFIDQGSNLRGRDFNLTLHWHVMPKTGKMFADKIVLPGYRLPESYR